MVGLRMVLSTSYLRPVSENVLDLDIPIRLANPLFLPWRETQTLHERDFLILGLYHKGV